jgi:hypothetical protein
MSRSQSARDRLSQSHDRIPSALPRRGRNAFNCCAQESEPQKALEDNLRPLAHRNYHAGWREGQVVETDEEIQLSAEVRPKVLCKFLVLT